MLVAIMLLAYVTPSANAQAPLEFTPYAIDVFIAVENPADLDDAECESLSRRVEDLSRAHIGAPWTLACRTAEGELLGEMLARLPDVPAPRLVEITPADARRDKAMYVVLTRSRSQWGVRLRELDFRTYRLSPVFERSHIADRRLAAEIVTLAARAFSPTAQLDAAQRDTVTGTLQATGLVVDADSPVLVASGEPLAAVIRHNDRLGRADAGDVLALPWTVLETIEAGEAKLTCQIHSAHHNPLGRKSRLRLVRYAQATRYPPRSARFNLQTPAGAPLAGYELIERDGASGTTAVLGQTDAGGRMVLPADDKTWRIMYVRHGERLMARLPILAGESQQYTVPLASDDVRLAAEGFVAALRQEVIDTVARRQILATRIRRRIAAEQFDEAQELLKEFRQLEDAQAYSRRLDEARRDLIADNARAQQLIDQMFAETRQVLARYLDPEEIKRLADQLAAARAEG